jgi:branched-chain amino acid transport system substrate-binding protein
MKDNESTPAGEQSTLDRRRFVAGAGLVLGGAAVAGGLGATRASAMVNRGAVNRGSQTLKLGATLPLTGFAAADGLEQKRAQQLAIEEWNAKGGVAGRKIEHIVLDLGTMEPANHQSIVRQLIDKYKVDAVVTGYTYYAGVELDLFAKSGIPYLNVNTNEDDATIVREDTEKYWNIYQYDPTNKWYGLGFPRFVNEIVGKGLFKPASKKIAIVYASDNYDTTIANLCRDAMTKNKWTVSLFEKVQSPINEWGPVLAKIKKSPPDIIFLASGVLGDQVSFAKAFTQDPTKSIIYGQYIPSLKEYREQTGQASEGAIWSTVIGILAGTPQAKAFRARFLKRWKTPASASTAGYMYDGVNLYLSSVRRAKTTEGKAVINALNTLHYKGVCGTFIFNPSDQCALNYPDQVKNPNGGIPHLYVQIQNRQDQIVAPAPFNTSKFKLPPYF